MKSIVAIHFLPPVAVAVAMLLQFLNGTELTAADNANVWSVQKVNESKPWDRLAASSTPIRVEGRVQTQGNGQIKLQHCDATFVVDKNKLQSVNSRSYVELRGRFKKDGARIVFAVDDVTVIPSYTDQFDSKKAKLRRPTAEEWVELGDWATERARIYDDPELSKRASEAYTSSIETEYQTLKRNEVLQKRPDPVGRFELAKKFETYKLSDRRRMELVHEGYRIQWQILQRADPPDPESWKTIAEQLRDQLPGATTPLKMIAPDLKDTYAQDPDAAYRKASDLVRPQLHRLFYISVLRKILLFDEAADGRDGDRIADRIDQLIPEESVLAESQRRKRMEFRVKNIATATRVEAEKLAAAYRERQEDETAKRVLAEWIKSHEAHLKVDGLQGLLQLSDEYVSLLDDRQSSLEYLLEASKIDPTFDGVKTRMIAFGYQLRNGRWIKAEGLPVEPATFETPTQITIGMSSTNLRSLLGQPRSLARVITSNCVTEVWIFGPASGSQLIVRLEQRAGDREPRVSRFSGQ